MWLHTITLCGLLGFVYTAEPLVTLTCVHGCVPNTQGIVAYAGTDIKLKYTVSDKLCVLEVKYKNELFISTFEPDLCRLDVRAVIGRDPRIEYLTDLVRVRNKFVYEFRLRDVSLFGDNGARFDYETDLRDASGKNVSGFDTIKVMQAPPSTHRPTTTTESPTTTEEPTTPTASTTPGPVNVRLSTAERATDMAGDLQSTTESATASTTDNVLLVQVGAATSGDDYPWPAVIGIICGSVFIILFVVVVLLAFRCRRAEQKPGYRSPTAKTEEGEVGTSAEIEKPSLDAIENGKIAVNESQPLFAEIEHSSPPPADTIKSEPNGDLDGAVIPPTSEEDDIFVQFEQGAAPGNPALVYTTPDEIEADDDKPRYASLSNQTIALVEDLEDYQLNIDSKLLNENNELIDDSSDNEEQPYVGIMKPKPPSDVIEPPFDVLDDSDVHDAPNDVFDAPDDFVKPVMCDVIINEPELVDTEIDLKDHLVSV